MAAKKTSHKTTKKKEVEIGQLPDVFDEEVSVKSRPVVVESIEEPEVSESVAPEKNLSELSAPRAPKIVTEIEEEPEKIKPPVEAPIMAPDVVVEPEKSIPATSSPESEPSFTVKQNGQTIEEPKLPSFFADDGEPTSSGAIITPDTQTPSPEIAPLEAAVPQAFVNEVREVASEAKRERKGMLVSVFIVLGMILVAAGAIGLFVLNSRKQNSVTETTTVVVPTPTPAPTPEVDIETMPTETASVSAEIKKEIKVNVLNGTSIKGLASKEAAVLKASDFTIGTVGNGDPAKAGTIVVPTGRLDMGQEITTLLSTYEFTVTEDEVQAITVTLPEPKP